MSTNRIAKAFEKKPIFMPYYPLGYPTLETSIDVIEELAKNGADLIEVGLSFSDPLADGPVIQKATQVALEQGITVKKALKAVAELRRRGVEIPLILMGYYNPMLAYGLIKFVQDAEQAGADGFIIPDLPAEESAEFLDVLGGSRLKLVTMLAPTTPPERMAALAKVAQGFIYLVSVTGVTGARTGVNLELGNLIKQIRQFSSVPVCVGFGISTPEQARQVGELADGVIVGSACVKAVGESKSLRESARDFAQQFSQALL